MLLMADDPIQMPPSKDRADAGGGRSALIPKSFMDRVAAGMKMIVGGGEWMGPSKPMAPVAPEDVKGRQFDYPVGYNLSSSNPRGDEPVGFDKMRALADNCDVLRAVIETRKDQIARMTWSIRPKDKDKKPDERCEQLKDFFAYPDQIHTWDDWLRMLLEEVFVTDAPTIYPRFTLGGGIYSLEPMDGATIKLLIDASGRRPMPPQPAYQQTLKGMPAVQYTADELIYKPRNPRVHKVYGFSYVEQIITTVHTLIRRALSQLAYFEAGTIPDAIAGSPETWTPEQIEHFQNYFDNLMKNDQDKRRSIRFMSKESASTYKEAKAPPLKDLYDEWLARIICYTFSVSCTPFVSQVNRAVAESNADQAQLDGLVPLQRWVKNLIDFIILKYFKIDDLCFGWDDEEDIAPKIQADIDAIYLSNNVVDVNEVRERLGMDARASTTNPAAPGQGTPMLDAAGKPMLDENGEPMLTQTTDPAPGGMAAAGAAGPDVQATALNGTQITSLQGIVDSVATGALPPESGHALIAAAFPTLSEEQINAMLDPLKNFEPKKPDPPPGFDENGATIAPADGSDPAAPKKAKPVITKSMGNGRGDLHIHLPPPADVVVDVGGVQVDVHNDGAAQSATIDRGDKS
jgi:hypothetical protein